GLTSQRPDVEAVPISKNGERPMNPAKCSSIRPMSLRTAPSAGGRTSSRTAATESIVWNAVPLSSSTWVMAGLRRRFSHAANGIGGEVLTGWCQLLRKELTSLGPCPNMAPYPSPEDGHG